MVLRTIANLHLVDYPHKAVTLVIKLNYTETNRAAVNMVLSINFKLDCCYHLWVGISGGSFVIDFLYNVTCQGDIKPFNEECLLKSLSLLKD